MLDLITHDVLTEIFSYLEDDLLKIPLLSIYFSDYFRVNKNYICHKIFKSNRKIVELPQSYDVFYNIIKYNKENSKQNIGIEYKLENYTGKNESYILDYYSLSDCTYHDYNANKLGIYLYKSVAYLLLEYYPNDDIYDIARNIIDHILQDRERANTPIEKLMGNLIYLLVNFIDESTLDIRYNIILHLINKYHIDLNEFDYIIYHDDDIYMYNTETYDIDIIWKLFENNYLDNCDYIVEQLIEKLFPYDERIFTLKDLYDIDVISYVDDLEQYIYNLIQHCEIEILLNLIKEFDIDIGIYKNVLDMCDIDPIYKLWENDVFDDEFDVLYRLYINDTKDDRIVEILNKSEIYISSDESILLFIAIENSDVEDVEFLINNNINYKICHTEYGYPLDYAALNGNLEIIKYLFRYDSDIEYKHMLINSCKNGCLEIVKYLSHLYKPDNEPINNIYIETASELGHLDLVEYFIENKIYESLHDVVTVACNNNQLYIVECLMQHGIKPDSKMLEVAILNKNNDVNFVNFLLTLDIEIPINLKLTGNAIKYGYLSVVKHLLNNGLEIRLNNNYCLYNTITYGHLHILEYLVQCGIKLKFEKIQCLRTAIINKYFDIIEYLCKNGVDIGIFYKIAKNIKKINRKGVINFLKTLKLVK
jgi:ankyrin repeat protein